MSECFQCGNMFFLHDKNIPEWWMDWDEIDIFVQVDGEINVECWNEEPYGEWDNKNENQGNRIVIDGKEFNLK